jgi:NTP pyrophosphatase (non-canonical NTP hydrolase)
MIGKDTLGQSRSRRRAEVIAQQSSADATRVDTVTDAPLREALSSFVAARDWDQFHSPANLAKSVAIEAGELLECYQWDDEPTPERVAGELADVLTYCHLLAAKLDLDPEQIVLDKLKVSDRKYPADRSRGRSTKYDQLPD